MLSLAAELGYSLLFSFYFLGPKGPQENSPLRPFAYLSLLWLMPTVASAAPFEFKPTDRVVVIGSTLIEREQRAGYWETLLTSRYPGIKFRNLGWSGDDVTGISRRAFDLDKPYIGRQRLVELALAEKPTVILIAYGANEAFEGEAGLAKFKAEYGKLLDELAPAKARIALVSPTPLENKGRPLPDPTAQNRNLATYRAAIEEVAKKRNVYFADLFNLLGTEGTKGLTDNSLHLTNEGYKQTALPLAAALGQSQDIPDWTKLEELRQAIVKKNELYFHRWRPQNETYLFGFRKHEQGRNAKEIVEFDPLIAEAEAQILKLTSK
jgi:lysophospholipase L1-like esterase